MTVDNPFDLHGRTVVVTGASEGGLGRAIAHSLAAAGAKLLISDHPTRERELQSTAAQLSEEFDTVAWQVADVAAEADVGALHERSLAELGRVDVLVHQAGVMQRQPTLQTPLADWQRVIDVNLTGTWLMNRAFAGPMVSRGRGKIVNTSSVYAAIVGALPESAYYASKAGIANLTRGLAAEWGPHGVTVNCVAPGVFYPTRMTAALGDDPGRLDTMTGRTMLGRLGDPATDIGGTLVWLSSRASDYVTGQVIYIDGGWSAW